MRLLINEEVGSGHCDKEQIIFESLFSQRSGLTSLFLNKQKKAAIK